MQSNVEVLVNFDQPVSDGQSDFMGRVLARPTSRGTWEAWIEFSSAHGAGMLVTGIESRQALRGQVLYWASGLSRGYAETALRRARPGVSLRPLMQPPGGDLPNTAALDRRKLRAHLGEFVLTLERQGVKLAAIGEHQLAADAAVLGRQAQGRLARLDEACRPVERAASFHFGNPTATGS